MTTSVQFLQVVTQSNLSWFSFTVGSKFPIMRETKTYWIINVFGDFEKKVMKSTCRLAGYKDSPQFAIFEPQPEILATVTETQLDLIPQKRPVGRPSTGKALTPAEKQARYRARKAKVSVTVTFNRDAVEALEIHIRALSAGHEVVIDPDKLQSILDSIRQAAHSQLVSQGL